MIIFLGNSHSLNLYKDFIETNKDCTPDIVVSCQYPHKIPDSLIKSHTVVNIHYGILPRYAGCNPVYRQILNEYQAGVTLHYVDSSFDSGDIIDIFTIPTGGSIASEVYETLAMGGLALLNRNFKAILAGNAPRNRQNLANREYSNKNDIDFLAERHLGDFDSLPDRKIRALTFPGKQYPIIRVKGRNYELRPVGTN